VIRSPGIEITSALLVGENAQHRHPSTTRLDVPLLALSQRQRRTHGGAALAHDTGPPLAGLRRRLRPSGTLGPTTEGKLDAALTVRLSTPISR
jgi:hypothetical protein